MDSREELEFLKDIPTDKVGDTAKDILGPTPFDPWWSRIFTSIGLKVVAALEKKKGGEEMI